MAEIRAYAGGGEYMSVLVDEEDAAWIRELPSLRIKDGYLVTEPTIRGSRPQRKRTVKVARLIVGLEPGDPLVVDHINRNRLDDRRQNLRIVTRSQNQQNLSAQRARNGSVVRSPHRGVTYFRGKWRAYLQVDGRRTYLGLFATEEEAARAVEDRLPWIIPAREPVYGGPGETIQKLHRVHLPSGRIDWAVER